MKNRLISRMAALLAAALTISCLSGCAAAGTSAPGGNETSENEEELPGAEDTESNLRGEYGDTDAGEHAAEADAEGNAACSNDDLPEGSPAPADGIYLADFDTDSSMFHVNEVWDGKGILTVSDGKMNIHLVMPSKKIVHLYYGTVEEAENDRNGWIEPIEETVTYPDGEAETVYAYDVPVPALGVEFHCALIGTKGVWYDHLVSVSDPTPCDLPREFPAGEEGSIEVEKNSAGTLLSCEVTLEGGSGRASVLSPTLIRKEGDAYIAVIEWSSPNYDFMMIGEQRFDPVNTDGNSVFEIPVEAFDRPIAVQADTVAMSTPHLIEYTLTFDSASLREK